MIRANRATREGELREVVEFYQSPCNRKIVEMEWITAIASHPVRINWIKPRQDGS